MTSITSKQLDILRLIYKFRFLNRHQIQVLLKHKSFNRINVWLSQLVKDEVVNRIYSRAFGENTKPAIYYLNVKSKRFLTGLEGYSPLGFTWVYRERGRSEKFIDHCISVVNLYIQLLASSDYKLIQFHSKTELLLANHLITPAPDAYIALEKPSKETQRLFLDIIDPGVPRYAIRKRIWDYFEYAEGKEWESATGHIFPSILVVCPNDFIRNYLYRLIKGISSDSAEQINFYLTFQSPDKKHVWQQVI